MSNTDIIEEIIGRFGRYQTWILVLLSVGIMPSVIQLGNVLFILPNVEYVCKDADAFNLSNHCPCKEVEYNRSVIYESVTSEWNLICDNTALASLAQSILQAGMLTGSLICGYISDRYGRKTSIYLSFLCQPIFIMISAFASSYWMFAACRFLSGCAASAALLTCYVYMVELSGKTFRSYLMGLQEISYVVGEGLLALIAYYVKYWRTLQLVTSIPWLVVIVYYWLIPESPRWLITVGRNKEAIEILTNIAKKNKRAIDKIENIINDNNLECMRNDQQKQGSYQDLFKTPKVRTYTIINAIVWMCCGHAYYGISQYIGRLKGNLYLNYFLSTSLLIPTLAALVLSALYVSRKTNVIITFFIAGASFLAHVFIPEDASSSAVTVAILGKLTIYASFTLIYLFTSEIFPTVIRNSAMGFASVIARFGAFVAPFVVNIGVSWISLSVFSAVTFCAAALCCFLPETKHIVLHNSIDQTEHSDK